MHNVIHGQETIDEADQVHLSHRGLEEKNVSADADAIITMTEAVNMVVERERVKDDWS